MQIIAFLSPYTKYEQDNISLVTNIDMCINCKLADLAYFRPLSYAVDEVTQVARVILRQRRVVARHDFVHQALHVASLKGVLERSVRGKDCKNELMLKSSVR